MNKNVKFSLLFSLMLVFFGTLSKAQSQLKKGDLVDGIAVVVGDEIILESDIEDQANFAKQQGANVADKCEFVESIINNKLLIYEAKRDTLIENRSAAIKDNANQKYTQILGQFPDEKTMLSTYKFRTSYEMKNAIEKIDSDNYYGQAKYGRITEKADVTPNEVTDFFTTFQYQLPEVKDEVSLSQIVMYPKLTDAHKDEIIARLNKIKADIQGGESFESQARIYSDDPGSAAKGGLYTNIGKGKMVKPFEAAALNLQEGEISDPVESDFGYHLIQLVKKSGKQYDARHILLKAEPNAEEIDAAKKELDSIRTLIIDGKMSFKDAAYRFSDDKQTKFNAGIVTSQEDGSDKIEKLNLPPTISYQIAGLNKGDITDVFQDVAQQDRKTVAIVKVDDVIAAHKLDISTDYNRIKQMALNKKKNEMVEKWVKEKLPNIFISINDRYKDCTFKTDWRKKVD
ncbi:peptidylprolyl isomerase [Kaistella flava (ex Peng et al. 2021)]|uniref:peptidylprolyl isomerase n=1 Tax=Kaistella flava (ex Peng et al. 2021) TaxID=2038776 RepID=A0A7M2Y472_9FLAO|nr:peptidylprolyl isomerase [Kaistella flava (ex Peng et al. 2021)]QOW08886.1 peptidylprolyl isomerase [Kaistella flava (ex Peng et al. 2021)]